MKILIVSDNSELTDSIQKLLLSKLGIKDILNAQKVEDALIHVKSQIKVDAAAALFGGKTKKICAIDLVFLDEALSGTPAHIFLCGVRKLYDKKALPVTIITKGDNKDSLIKILKSGANNFVLQPVSGELLEKKIAEATGKDGGQKVESAVGVFQMATPKKKGGRIKKSPILQMMSSKGRKSGAGSLIGAYYSTKPDSSTEKIESGGDVQDTKKSQDIEDNGILINGHYHEKVNVIGGGFNCFWAKESAGNDKIDLEYVSAKGKPSGIHAKLVAKSDFLENFTLCTPEICPILKRLQE